MTLEEKRDIIAEKIKILKHFAIIPRGDHQTKSIIISILGECKTEMEMEQKLYNLLHGAETLDDFINRHHTLFLRRL